MESAAKKEAPKYQWRIGTWFPSLTPETHAKLKLYNEELMRFNRSISLISTNTTDKVDLVHFADSISGWGVVRKDFKGSAIFDIGSGNGFPGVVISILEPSLNVFLLESDIRKSEFLKHCVDVCSLKNTKVIARRLEELDPGSISAGVIRGFANIPKALLAFRKIMAPKGKLYHFKGPEWITELTAMPQQLCSTWNTEHLGDYSLPEGKTTHTIVRSDLL